MDERPRPVAPLELSAAPEEQTAGLSLAERGAAAEREFARLEKVRKAAAKAAMEEKLRMSLGAAPPLRASGNRSTSPNRSSSPSYRTPRTSAFDSRLGEAVASYRSQRSHRTPREPLMSQNLEDKHFNKVLTYGGQRHMSGANSTAGLAGQRRPLVPY